MEIVKKIFNKEIILYLIFGFLTTIISILIYWLFYNFVLIDILDNTIKTYIANTISFVFSVLFAFVTNKAIVFNSKTSSKMDYFKVLISFFICRILTYIIDTYTILFLNTFILQTFKISEKLSSLIAKLISNVLVILLNYMLSKFFIFKKKNS